MGYSAVPGTGRTQTGRVVRFSVCVALLAACGGSDPPPTTTIGRPTTTTLSPFLEALAQTQPKTTVHSPIIATFLLDRSRGGLTREQFVADQIQPYSSRRVTAVDVGNLTNFICQGAQNAANAANSVTSVMDRATPRAVVAFDHFIRLIVVTCEQRMGWSSVAGLTAQAQSYLNDIVDFVGTYLVSRPLPTVTTTTLAKPKAIGSRDDDMYKGICAGSSAAVSASSWYSAMKGKQGGLLGLAVVAFALSYCPSVLGSVLR